MGTFVPFGEKTGGVLTTFRLGGSVIGKGQLSEPLGNGRFFVYPMLDDGLKVPVWFCLTETCREDLQAFEWRNHRRKLKPPMFRTVDVETPGQVERIMAEPPHKPMGDRG